MRARRTKESKAVPSTQKSKVRYHLNSASRFAANRGETNHVAHILNLLKAQRHIEEKSACESKVHKGVESSAEHTEEHRAVPPDLGSALRVAANLGEANDVAHFLILCADSIGLAEVVS